MKNKTNISKRRYYKKILNSEILHNLENSFVFSFTLIFFHLSKSGTLVATLCGHKDTVMSLKWNVKGNFLLSASLDKVNSFVFYLVFILCFILLYGLFFSNWRKRIHFAHFLFFPLNLNLRFTIIKIFIFEKLKALFYLLKIYKNSFD